MVYKYEAGDRAVCIDIGIPIGNKHGGGDGIKDGGEVFFKLGGIIFGFDFQFSDDMLSELKFIFAEV